MQRAACATGILFTLSSVASAQEVVTSTWGSLPEGREIQLFTLTNKQGTRVRIAEYGALLVSAETKNREGKLGNITLSYDSLEAALAGGVYGSVIGRFANRIDGGGFRIDGKRFDLESVNARTNVHIHGGKTGFHRQPWSGRADADEDAARVVLSLTSPDGHEGYPGTVEATVTYELSNDDLLRVRYRATTDKPTHVNLTNHAYFNLAGTGDILEHELHLVSENRLDIDDRKIPTGKLVAVAGTPFDFREEKRIGKEIEAIEGGGYDHCFVIPVPESEEDAPSLPAFATLTDPGSGRTLSVATSKPGAQIYTANHFKGNPYPRWAGICFETQFYPDTPNQPDFPSSLLRPGEVYDHTTEFRFGLREKPGEEKSDE